MAEIENLPALPEAPGRLLFEFRVTASGVAHDADGTPLDRFGNRVVDCQIVEEEDQ